MPGPVFVHCQTFATKENAARQSVAQVIEEALRVLDRVRHVADPKPPRVLLGDPKGFAKEHAAHVAARATKVRTKKGVKSRAIRADRHTLATIVASYPLTHEQVAAGGDEARAHHAEWERRTLEWARARYGDQLRVALAHDDEDHPHLHLWLLPDDPGADATTLHPGKVAKRQVEAERKAEGVAPREAVAAGNKALKEAMRGWITDYHAEVGVPLGMTRDGPKRRRLSRAQWRAEKEGAGHRARLLQDADKAAEKAVEAVFDEADALGRARLVTAALDARKEALAQAEAEVSAQRGRLAATWEALRSLIPRVRGLLLAADTIAEHRSEAVRARADIVGVYPAVRAAVKAEEAASEGERPSRLIRRFVGRSGAVIPPKEPGKPGKPDEGPDGP